MITYNFVTNLQFILKCFYHNNNNLKLTNSWSNEYDKGVIIVRLHSNIMYFFRKRK